MKYFKDLDLSLTHLDITDWDLTVYFGRQVSPFPEYYTELVCQLPEFSRFEPGLGLPVCDEEKDVFAGGGGPVCPPRCHLDRSVESISTQTAVHTLW